MRCDCGAVDLFVRGSSLRRNGALHKQFECVRDAITPTTYNPEHPLGEGWVLKYCIDGGGVSYELSYRDKLVVVGSGGSQEQMADDVQALIESYDY